MHYIDVIVGAIASKSPASWLFTQSFIQTQIKENIKVPRHWSLCGDSPGTGEFPAQMASNAENGSISWRHHGMVELKRYWVCNNWSLSSIISTVMLTSLQNRHHIKINLQWNIYLPPRHIEAHLNTTNEVMISQLTSSKRINIYRSCFEHTPHIVHSHVIYVYLKRSDQMYYIGL